MEKRKQEVKSLMVCTQGMWEELARRFSSTKSPCCRKVRYHRQANRNQLKKGLGGQDCAFHHE